MGNFFRKAVSKKDNPEHGGKIGKLGPSVLSIGLNRLNYENTATRENIIIITDLTFFVFRRPLVIVHRHLTIVPWSQMVLAATTKFARNMHFFV